MVKRDCTQANVECFPDDWELKSLGQFIALQRGHDLTERARRQGEVPVMGSAGPNGLHDTALVRGPGVVLGRSGASFGQAHYCISDFWPHNTALYVTDFFGNDPLFVYYFLKRIDFSRHNSGGAQQSLNRNFIAPIPVAIPRLEEQEVIAAALSDADALIETLEQLLEKKRHIKQGATQELLTGKKRLPGFEAKLGLKQTEVGVIPEDWEVVDAGSIGRFRGGNGFPTIHQGISSGEYPFFKVSDMNNEGNETFMDVANNYISEATRRRLGANAFPPQTIVFAKVGAAIFLERKKLLTKASCLDNNMAGFSISDAGADHRYIYYFFLNFRLGSLVSTTALPSLNGSVLRSIKIKAAQQHVHDRKGGIIWHTQGSGKSIVMVLVAKWILETNPNARVAIITDRDELDKQIEGVFTGAGIAIARSRSGRQLLNQLGQALPRLLCSMVHKFGSRDADDLDAFIKELEAKPSATVGEVFVFVDECHRTQSGKLHRLMKAMMPNAIFIGFTGTPLLKKDARSSLEVFGGYPKPTRTTGTTFLGRKSDSTCRLPHRGPMQPPMARSRPV